MVAMLDLLWREQTAAETREPGNERTRELENQGTRDPGTQGTTPGIMTFKQEAFLYESTNHGNMRLYSRTFPGPHKHFLLRKSQKSSFSQ